MRVGIYNQPAEGGIGGSEISVAVLAEALARYHHQVEIIHHKSYVDRDRLAVISNTDLSDVGIRHVAVDPYSFGSTHNPFRRFKEATNWQKTLSEPYDFFINFTHGFPPFCHARRGALVVLFPFDQPPHFRLRNQLVLSGTIRSAHKLAYHVWEWRKRLASYQFKTAISQFSRFWAARRWGVDCDVLYPPVEMKAGARQKENLILSVGRFTVTGHSKKQLEMIAAFDALQKTTKSDWDYVSVGGVSGAKKDLEYFRNVRLLTENCRAQALANLDDHRLGQLYARSKIFWHAAGYGEADNRPELSEHFGISTVEAMSAGCVPVVIDKGGQREIVEHGISGFFWSSLEELKGYTELLMRDEKLRARMEVASRERALTFSRENFVGRFLQIVDESRPGVARRGTVGNVML